MAELTLFIRCHASGRPASLRRRSGGRVGADGTPSHRVRGHAARRGTSICPYRRLLVLDCGGGPGRYAIQAGATGNEVLLFYLSAGNLALAREKAAEAGVVFDFRAGHRA